MKQYKIKDSIDLFIILPKYDFTFFGNYNRGDNWVREQNGIDNLLPKNGIVIHGDWDRRKIFFKHPYRGTTEDLDISTFIEDLVKDGLAEFVDEIASQMKGEKE